jgi:hypothetical protein
MLLDEEWLEHGFVGALSWPVVLWAWDQCAMAGWNALAEIAADALWLLRRDIRKLDEFGGSADDLRDLFAKRLRAVPLAEFQALYAATHRPTPQALGTPADSTIQITPTSGIPPATRRGQHRAVAKGPESCTGHSCMRWEP